MPEQQPNPRRRLRREPDTPGFNPIHPEVLDQLGWLWRDVHEKYIPDPKREQSYREIKARDDAPINKTLLPPPPTRFQRDPLIQGRPSFVREATRLLNADPYVKNNVNKILIGPSSEMIKGFLNAKADPAQFENSRVAAGYDIKNDISINPKLWTLDSDNARTPMSPNSPAYLKEKLGYLAHELTHATNYRHGDTYIPNYRDINGDLHDFKIPKYDPADVAEYTYLWNRPDLPPVTYPTNPKYERPVPNIKVPR